MTAVNGTVNEAVRAAGQPIDVVKGPFKGKGGEVALWCKDAETKLSALYRDMANLRDESKTVTDRRFSVDVYSLSHRNSKSLRWRMNDGAHMTWARIVPMLTNMPPSMVWWYHELQARMMVMNAQEKVARYQLKVGRHLMLASQEVRPK